MNVGIRKGVRLGQSSLAPRPALERAASRLVVHQVRAFASQTLVRKCGRDTGSQLRGVRFLRCL